MKKVLSVLVAAALVTVATSAMALTIVGTKHDLSSTGGTGYKTSSTQVCVFCHTPHNAVANRALWNRNASTQTFTTYTSGANIESATWYAGGTKGSLPSTSPSMLCLSCHDGVSTMGNIARPPAGVALTGTIAITAGGAKLGSDLTNDHPISINYNTVQTALGATSLKVADAAGYVVAASTNRLPLANATTLECATCHNVHDNTNVPFLRDTMTQSALCTACHKSDRSHVVL